MTWLLLLVGLAFAFIASAAGAALVTTARGDIAEAIARHLRGARESLDWLTSTERQVVAATAATSLGVTLVGATLPGFFQSGSALQVAVVVIVVGVPATLLVGYLLPRLLTQSRAERVVETITPVLHAWTALLAVVLPSRESDPATEIHALAREGSASGVGGEELVMVGGVMTFAERPVRAVMTPRTEVVAVSREATAEQLERVVAETGYTRIPVYGATLDEIVGMVHAFDLLKRQTDEPIALRPVSFAPERRPAGDVLLDMQRERQHLAVVVDEFGGTAGIVTLEDLLEALVGEIADEDDTVPVPMAAGAVLVEVDGDTPVSLIAEQFGVNMGPTEVTSIGGLLVQLAGRIPLVGDRFSYRELEFDVLAASANRIERLLIRRGGAAAIPLERRR